jgi:hypothetical protein
VAKQAQVSLTGGELSPSLWSRVDLARYATSLSTCKNFCVSATGGVFNRAGLEFVYALDPDSLATLIPFVFSTSQTYMLVFQEETIKVYTNGAYVENTTPISITNITFTDPNLVFCVIETATPHGLDYPDTVTISGVTGTGSMPSLNRTFVVQNDISPTEILVNLEASELPVSGVYGGGGQINAPVELSTPYLSADLASLRYTQSADVVTIVNQLYTPYEFVRLGATSFTFDAIDDFEGGPFLDDNVTATTVTASATTGTGITLTASSSIFTADHVGALFRITIEDLSAIPPWEPDKHIAATGVDPDGLYRLSNGKVYIAAGNSAAPSAGTFTGTVPPKHDSGIESDGDGNLRNGTANTRAGVSWQYVHSMFGIVRITAQAGTTATADVLSTLPIVSPATTTIWAFGAWSEDQGYPALVTYYQDRLVLANTPGAPQTEWASKTGDYHNFGKSSPLVANDAITQPLNARQINAIVELVPMDQLIALTSSSSWASPKRGEDWTPLTIGYDPQSFDGAEFLRSILTGESCLFVQDGATKVRDLAFKTENDKFRGDELTILARHLFGTDKYIVDLDYAKEPYGILWMVRSDGALIGLTYLREQEVIGWHRHDTDGFFERVCVIKENGVDTPYFVIRRTVGGDTVRYLERMAIREDENILDSFFVDSGLSYDGRNTTATTITISGASYAGGDTVTLTASASIFASTDVGSDAIQFPSDDGNVRVSISGFSSATSVTGILQAPVPASLQSTATTTWTFARDTFSGLSHLEGRTVAILADGSPEVQQVVTDGQITLAYPAGVVHIGLPYVSDVETLDVNLFNSNDGARDRSKVIPKVAVAVEKTLGLKGGPDADNLYDIGLQPADFDYNAPWELQSEVQTAHIITNYDKKGRVFLRQSQPLPATILSITPTVELGGEE